jgi:hypothetical protein
MYNPILGPNPLRGPFDNKGQNIGCKSACVANLDGHPGQFSIDPMTAPKEPPLMRVSVENSNNCCSGSHNKPETCPKSKVQFYNYFKDACPNAYVYAYDDKTALKTCPSGKNADYTLTFCP